MPINKIPTKAFTTIDLIVDNFTATAGQTQLTLSAPTTANACIVTVNDVLQVPTTDYTVNESVLTFINSLTLNDTITVRILTRPVGFVPSSGGSGGSGLVEETVVIANTSQTEIDSFSANSYRAADYHILCSSNFGFNSLRLSIVHNNSNVQLTQYAAVGSSQGSISSTIISGNVKLYFTPSNANTEIKFVRTTINNSGNYSETNEFNLEGDLLSQSGFEDLEVGSGILDLL
jgi:hypothetical protein